MSSPSIYRHRLAFSTAFVLLSLILFFTSYSRATRRMCASCSDLSYTSPFEMAARAPCSTHDATGGVCALLRASRNVTGSAPTISPTLLLMGVPQLWNTVDRACAVERLTDSFPRGSRVAIDGNVRRILNGVVVTVADAPLQLWLCQMSPTVSVQWLLGAPTVESADNRTALRQPRLPRPPPL